MNELCKDKKGHESKMLRLVGGLLELSVEMDCEYLDVHVDDEMNATTMHESISKTHAEVNIPER